MEKDSESALTSVGDSQNPQEQKPVVASPGEIVRIPKAIVTLTVPAKKINQETVSFKYYNSFNYDLLPKKDDELRVALGITSANQGEGKTLVASNLAVSLAMGYQKKTVLVDLNVAHPTLHQVFGTPQSPGLLDALRDGTIHVSQTKVPYLSVLATGDGLGGKSGADAAAARKYSGERLARLASTGLGLGQMAAFADVIYSLKQEYEFVIVDMPAINTGHFPILFANRLSGLLVVVDTSTTKRADIDKMFRQLSEHQVLGFVFNKVKDEES
ncbi:MAG TPA: CpsD/CapB family tyrosine-protein kinase [Bacteroidota bacterium]